MRDTTTELEARYFFSQGLNPFSLAGDLLYAQWLEKKTGSEQGKIQKIMHHGNKEKNDALHRVKVMTEHIMGLLQSSHVE